MSAVLPRNGRSVHAFRVVKHHQAFRAVLLACSYPGRLFAVSPDDHWEHDGKLSPAEAAAALVFGAIWEPTTRVCPIGSVRFLPPTIRPASESDAEVLAVVGAQTHGMIGAAYRGSEEAPESGATVMYLLEGTAAGTPVTLTGPGIQGTSARCLALPQEEVIDRNAACSRWPLGIDVLIVNERGEVMALPRTTRVALVG